MEVYNLILYLTFLLLIVSMQFLITRIIIHYFYENMLIDRFIEKNNLVSNAKLESIKKNKKKIVSSPAPAKKLDANYPYVINSKEEELTKKNITETTSDIEDILKEDCPKKNEQRFKYSPESVNKLKMSEYFGNNEIKLIVDVFGELIVYDVDICKIRLGNKNNRGFLILNYNLNEIKVMYSYGLDNELMFESMFAKRYKSLIRLYDNNLEKIPYNNNFRYRKECINSDKNSDKHLIESHVMKNKDLDKRKLLKINVEGAEYETILAMKLNILESFEQIIITVYNTNENLKDLRNLLEKLNKVFYIFHIHANNVKKDSLVNQYSLPKVLEICWVRKDLVKDAYFDKRIVSILDSPNFPSEPDVVFRLPFNFEEILNEEK